MTYGLTQKLIKRTRERFQSGELTHEEAMWFLKFEYEEAEYAAINYDINQEM